MYDVIVVGGGHAGIEATLINARNGMNVLLVTGNINNIADMPCNPSIGGSAKGIVVREIDALGGTMGYAADRSHLQIKLLNSKKGPGVRSLRCQADKKRYHKVMMDIINSFSNITIKEALVKDLIVENNAVCGVVTEENEKFYSKKTILTTGTYLNSDILCGHTKEKGGPHGEKTALYLSKNLEKYGLKIIRLKTGTPPRVLKSSINFEECEIEKGDNKLLTFSYFDKPTYKVREQVPCYLTYTNKTTHEIILNNLNECALFSGLIVGKGPRYCPSIEDKIVKFRDKERHQIFLEPELENGDEIYIGGFSTTMPHPIQEKLLHTMNGLHNAKITKYGYAIEYDALDPTELNIYLESKKLKNLYTAGQINGTSGYEEAAAQGLIAGINAFLSIKGKSGLVLKRNEAYIGVLIDDLINKGITEPYRLLTSRAEFRLILRHDNADLRLTPIAHSLEIIDDKKYKIYENKIKKINELKRELNNTVVHPTAETNTILKKYRSSEINTNIKALTLLKRPELNINAISKLIGKKIDAKIGEQVEISVKYEGYINKTNEEVKKMLKLEDKKIPTDIDYNKVRNIATEARQKLSEIKPITIGQASRISGVNPADISMLLVYLKKEYPYD